MDIQEGAVGIVDEDDEDEDLRYEVLPAVTRPPRTVSESDPGYEKIQLKNEDSFSDPRYERIQLKTRTAVESQIEPNYEIVGFRWYAIDFALRSFIFIIFFLQIILFSADIKESSEPGYEEVERSLQSFDRRDPNYESLHYNEYNTGHTFTEPPYATVDRVDPPEEPSELPPAAARPDIQQEPSNNNNSVGAAIYAQVVKPKRAAGTVLVTSPAAEGDHLETPTNRTVVDLENHQDFSVSSSRNTTIIRITDNRPAFRYYSNDDDTFGVPEQVWNKFILIHTAIPCAPSLPYLRLIEPKQNLTEMWFGLPFIRNIM